MTIISLVEGGALTILGAIATVVTQNIARRVREGPIQSRFKSLAGVYSGTARQGTVIDKIELYLKTYQRKKVSGKLLVYYQNEAGQYASDPEIMRIKGTFRYDTFLTIEYDNENKARKQGGTLCLVYNSDENLEGNFAAYFDKVPKGRKDLIGLVVLKKTLNRQQ